MTNPPASIKMSQGYDVLKPKSDHAIPVPCNEWDVLKKNIKDATTDPWFFHTTGSILIGASLATLISIVTGTISSQSIANAIVIAWAVTIVCGLTGIACLYFAHKERGVHRQRNQNVVEQMQLIESRFDRPVNQS